MKIVSRFCRAVRTWARYRNSAIKVPGGKSLSNIIRREMEDAE